MLRSEESAQHDMVRVFCISPNQLVNGHNSPFGKTNPFRMGFSCQPSDSSHGDGRTFRRWGSEGRARSAEEDVVVAAGGRFPSALLLRHLVVGSVWVVDQDLDRETG